MKMKATKKIVGAACALVAAVALSAGSTFAWFSSNGSVKATGLAIDVNTSNSYLVIGNDLTDITPATGENFSYKTSITLDSTATKLLPSAYNEIKDGGVTLATTGTGSIVDVGSWYTAKGKSPTDGSMEEDEDGKQIKTTLTTFDEYVVVDEIFVSAAVGSEEVDNVYLNITPANSFSWSANDAATDNNSAISVVVLYQTNTIGQTVSAEWKMQEYNAKNNHVVTDLDLGPVSSTTYIQIHVMVYFDGNNDLVKSSNAKNLKGITLDFNFSDTASSTPDVGD